MTTSRIMSRKSDTFTSKFLKVLNEDVLFIVQQDIDTTAPSSPFAWNLINVKSSTDSVKSAFNSVITGINTGLSHN